MSAGAGLKTELLHYGIIYDFVKGAYMKWKEIEKIMKKHDKYAKMLEEYDRTGKLPIKKRQKIRKA